jgi:hypothetical protein
LQSLGRIFTQLPMLVRFIGSGMVFGEAGFGFLLGRGYVVFGGIGASCLWGITTEDVERCWGSA